MILRPASITFCSEAEDSATMSKKSGLSTKNSKVIANSKIDDFRAVIRTLAADSVISISAFLHSTLDPYVATKDKKAVISFENFQRGLSKFPQLKQKFSKSDLEDIFSECDEIEDDMITIDGLADFCQRTISKARAIALKLRSAILKEFFRIHCWEDSRGNECIEGKGSRCYCRHQN